MAGDVVVEAAGEGTDTIYFKGSTSYVLGANLENLYMSNAVGAVNGTGNGLDNSISGNDDVNILTGGGGDDNLFGHGGADTMIGGIGDDDYWVGDAGDVVTELADQGTDKIYSGRPATCSEPTWRSWIFGCGRRNQRHRQRPQQRHMR